MFVRTGMAACVAALISLGTAVPVCAQSQNLPGSADPSRFDERFGIVPAMPEADVEPPQTLKIENDIPKTVDGFVLRDVTLSGLTVFSQKDFQDILNEYIGRPADLEVLRHLAARITAHYREEGYFLSKVVVPAQEIENGHVRLQVVEGYVHDVFLDDPSGLLKSDFLGLQEQVMAQIRALDPLHGPSLERYLLILNDGAGLHVQSVMGATPDIKEPGAVDITLKVTRRPQSVALDYNNHGSRFIGPHQTAITYEAGALFNSYDTLTLQATTTIPLREVQYGSLSYSLPLAEDGLRLYTSASYANSKPGSTLKPLEVESDSFSWEGGFRYPLIRSRRTNLTVSARLSVQNTATEFLDEELIDDKVRSVILGADYNTQDDWEGLSALSVNLHKGLDILGARKTGSADLSRAQGRSDFVKLEASAARVQQLPGDFNVLIRLGGQYAPHPLLSSAEFGYGGANLGRAYDSSELTGDKGVSGGLELRYGGVGPLGDIVYLTPFVFYDAGKVWNDDRGEKPASGASAGFGTYYQVNDPISGSLAVAWPLTKSVAVPVMGGEDGPRVLFEWNVQF
jgi:hemolysin activation/secretion protein